MIGVEPSRIKSREIILMRVRRKFETGRGIESLLSEGLSGFSTNLGR
jgi:hypothetical protein